MSTIFLKDGRMADLVTKTDKGYLVDPYISWNDYDGQAESAPSGNVELVAEIFNSAPIDLIDSEYKAILQKVQEQEKILAIQRAEVNELNRQTMAAKNQKTDLSRFIINREELRTAKRLVLWPTDEIKPRIMDGSKSHKFSLSYEISQYKGEERVWCYKVHNEERRGDGYSTYSQYYDETYGIKIDLTDEEILKMTQDRIGRFKKDYHSWKNILLRTDDEWLTPEYIEEKKQLKEADRQYQITQAEKELAKAKDNLEKLKKELTVS